MLACDSALLWFAHPREAVAGDEVVRVRQRKGEPLLDVWRERDRRLVKFEAVAVGIDDIKWATPQLERTSPY